MDNFQISDTLIRDYLLGRVDGEMLVAEQIDEQVFTDAEFPIRVDAVEDELIEEYLEDTLDAEEKQAVERHFLTPPERQRKLRNARLLRRHLAAIPLQSRDVVPVDSTRSILRSGRPIFLRQTLRTYAEIAAAVLVAVSIVYLFQQRRELKSAVDQANKQLVLAHQQATALKPDLRDSTGLSEPLTVMLNLVQPGLRRGKSDLPSVDVRPATRVLRVEIAVASGSPGTYRVQLESGGNTIWVRDAVQALVAPGGAIINVEIPPEVLPAGRYELVLQGPEKSGISYWFNVTRLR